MGKKIISEMFVVCFKIYGVIVFVYTLCHFVDQCPKINLNNDLFNIQCIDVTR